MEHLTAEIQKAQGAHYTSQELAEFVAKNIMAAWLLSQNEHRNDSATITILDPAVGGGELLAAIYLTLPEQFRSRAKLIGLDNDLIAIESARTRLSKLSENVDINQGDFLETISGGQPDLFGAMNNLLVADLIIANPPYVRTQVLGSTKSQALAAKFALQGRVDLSFPFVLGIIEKLRPGGVAGIITSNRFLSTRSGASLRERLRSDADVLHVWDLGDTKLFDAAVLPCILLIQKAPPRKRTLFTSVYSVTPQERRPNPSKLFDALSSSNEGVVDIGDISSRYQIKRGNLEVDDDLGAIWKLRNSESLIWADNVKKNVWKTLGELTKVRVGVKTTADFVFIRGDWPTECPNGVPETLRPLITHHLAGRFRGKKPDKQILYTHETVNGKKRTIELSHYPHAAEYLNRFYRELDSREYLRKAGREWFEVWVPQEPSAWDYPKIVFKDIAVKPTFWLDTGGSVVNGDCYWFSLGNELTDIYWLALGVFNSTFIERFYDAHFPNKLYSGRRRFMTQYVSQFPLPCPKTKAAENIIKISRELFDTPERENELFGKLNESVAEAFGLSSEEI
ncbi:MAG: N-6 DNA methylase [Verrucomicrobia bacterium]|nr:N-6 DNA methylase [Verrucomicrobiota bacterium]